MFSRDEKTGIRYYNILFKQMEKKNIFSILLRKYLCVFIHDEQCDKKGIFSSK